MAHFNERIEDSNGNMVEIRVPSLQKGTDRTIYVNGNSTKYCLGKENDKIYNKHSGSEVSELPLKKFVRAFIDKDDQSIYSGGISLSLIASFG